MIDYKMSRIKSYTGRSDASNRALPPVGLRVAARRAYFFPIGEQGSDPGPAETGIHFHSSGNYRSNRPALLFFCFVGMQASERQHGGRLLRFERFFVKEG
jgi:hypothetical protein